MWNAQPKKTAERTPTTSGLLRWSMVFALVAGLPALAQTNGADGTKADGVQADAAKAPAPPRRDENLFKDDSGREVPVSQYIPLSDQSVQEMRKELTNSLEVLRAAREAKDAVRLNCVNDKITAMKGMLRISEDSFITLQEAMSSNASDKARYEFGKIKVSRKKMAQLSLEAANCSGAEATYTGAAEVILEEDQELLGTDPYYGDTDFFATPEDTVSSGDTSLPGDNEPIDTRPPPASPFQGE